MKIKNKRKKISTTVLLDDVEPDGLDMELRASSAKCRQSQKLDKMPVLYKECLGDEGIKVKNTSGWFSQAGNSFKVKVTKDEKKRRKEREMRFSANQSVQNSHKEEKSSDEDDALLKSISSALSSSRIPGEPKKKRSRQSVNLVGRNRHLEKPYFRLTMFPKAEDVRPLNVLRQSLKHIKEQYLKDEDFTWANEQLKSVRQDITVQGLKSAFVLEVYETHARILLEHGDLNEFNQCQTMIHSLTTGVAESIGGDFLDDTELLGYEDDGDMKLLLSQTDERKDEFGGYRLLYALVQNADVNMSLNETRLTVKEKTKDSSSQTLSSCLHAIQVAKAVIHNDYRHFFQLYDTAPHLSAFLMDFLVKRVRDAAYERIVASYRPSIGIEQFRTSLNFEDLDETKRFLKQSGAVFIKEKGEPRFWVDCKASKTRI